VLTSAQQPEIQMSQVEIQLQSTSLGWAVSTLIGQIHNAYDFPYPAKKLCSTITLDSLARTTVPLQIPDYLLSIVVLVGITGFLKRDIRLLMHLFVYS